jgi:hypothetical protein
LVKKIADMYGLRVRASPTLPAPPFVVIRARAQPGIEQLLLF